MCIIHFHVKCRKAKYHFAVNGQTGKVVGRLPVDKTTSLLYFLRRAGSAAVSDGKNME